MRRCLTTETCGGRAWFTNGPEKVRAKCLSDVPEFCTYEAMSHDRGVLRPGVAHERARKSPGEVPG